MAFDIHSATQWSWGSKDQVKQEIKRLEKIEKRAHRMKRMCEIVLEEKGVAK